MVTAILPSLTDETQAQTDVVENPPLNPRHSMTPSVASEVTITPDRFRDYSTSESGFRFDGTQGKPEGRGKPSALAGYVGLFTGCGALVALSLFLPLPARFGQIKGVTLGQAVQYSYYVVGVISFLVAIFVFFGLRGIKGEEGKGFRTLLGLDQHRTHDNSAPYSSKQVSPYLHLLRDSIRLGLTDSDIALGYLGGFVARASTVAISLFVPLFINAFFIRNGFCQGSPNDPSPELKKECRQAYILSSILTGVAQLMGLLCAPLFGYLSSRKFTKKNKLNYPIIVATTFGIAGYIAFPQLRSPEYKDKDGRGGSPAIFFLAALIGISQIGAIVCSLGSLGRGVLKVDVINTISHPHRVDRESEIATITEPADSRNETAPLLENPAALPEDTVSRVRLKGSVAGVYSWCGGAAILLLTKAGGYGFDVWSTGAPFYMMAGFNAILLVVSLGIDAGRFGFKRKRGGTIIYGHQVPSAF